MATAGTSLATALQSNPDELERVLKLLMAYAAGVVLLVLAALAGVVAAAKALSRGRRGGGATLILVQQHESTYGAERQSRQRRFLRATVDDAVAIGYLCPGRHGVRCDVEGGRDIPEDLRDELREWFAEFLGESPDFQDGKIDSAKRALCRQLPSATTTEIAALKNPRAVVRGAGGDWKTEYFCDLRLGQHRVVVAAIQCVGCPRAFKLEALIRDLP